MIKIKPAYNFEKFVEKIEFLKIAHKVNQLHGNERIFFHKIMMLFLENNVPLKDATFALKDVVEVLSKESEEKQWVTTTFQQSSTQ